MPQTRKSLAERFWPKVEKTDTCWLWTAGKSHDGYGFIGTGGRRAPHVYAHRYAYESLVGPIPDGLQLDHLCRVRNCVNPAHLEPVTARVNHSRTPKATKTHCVRGHEYAAGNLVIQRGRRTCGRCARERKRKGTELSVCIRCGVTTHRIGTGWRHAVNAKTASRTCGMPPICRPLLADEVSS